MSLSFFTFPSLTFSTKNVCSNTSILLKLVLLLLLLMLMMIMMTQVQFSIHMPIPKLYIIHTISNTSYPKRKDQYPVSKISYHVHVIIPYIPCHLFHQQQSLRGDRDSTASIATMTSNFLPNVRISLDFFNVCCSRLQGEDQFSLYVNS